MNLFCALHAVPLLCMIHTFFVGWVPSLCRFCPVQYQMIYFDCYTAVCVFGDELLPHWTLAFKWSLKKVTCSHMTWVLCSLISKIKLKLQVLISTIIATSGPSGTGIATCCHLEIHYNCHCKLQLPL